MIPEWLIKIFPSLKSANSEEWKAISEARKNSFEEIRVLKDEYKLKVEELEKRLKKAEGLHPMNQHEIDELQEREKDNLRELIKLTEENRTLKEYIIFMKFVKDSE